MYHQTIEKTLQDLATSRLGLTFHEALKRQNKFGRNEFQEKKKISLWWLFLRQFKDFMILILIAVAILLGFLGDTIDTIIILIIVMLNALVGFFQEYQADKAIESLKKMAIAQTTVIRDEKPIMISSTELVPGDIVILEAGNVVPADLRLLETYNLRIDESSLTGESIPIDKIHSELLELDVPLGDQINMAFKGTMVTTGRAIGVVVNIGMKTELGRIAGLLQEKKENTPLQLRMNHFSVKLSYVIILICFVLFLTGYMRGEEPLKLLLLSISLAVAAIPEALPALITIALAQGASRLATKQALIRKLPAVETLGSVNFICSDKTGTLTQNKMDVVAKHEANALLTLCMAMNHDIKFDQEQQLLGESTELALVHNVLSRISYREYVDLTEKHPRLQELPFDSERKCMTTLHRYDEKILVITKGSMEAIANALQNEGERKIIEQYGNQWAHEGKRVLAYAFKIINALPESDAAIEKELTLAGIVALIDPPRPEVKLAIAECKTAGIKTVMITGDHPATAKTIAKEIGILEEGDLVLTGAELQRLNHETFLSQVEKISVYARVSPDQKLQIVKALQAKGNFVAMTGDGVNDAPSLKAANIGVAMGINGTDVSKESADFILLDDHFETIVNAVKEGRRIFDNIRKFIKYMLTCNGAEIWTIFMAPLIGMPIPLLPIHILWINLITDALPALALANEKAEVDVMHRRPRPTNESLFSDGVGFHVIWVGLLMAGITLGVQAWSIHHQLVHWQTMVFTVLSISQLGHVLAVRSDHTFLYKQGFSSNPALLLSVLLTFLLQMAVIYLPFMNTIFKTQPLTLKELGICLGGAVVLFHAVEIEKYFKRKRKQRPKSALL